MMARANNPENNDQHKGAHDIIRPFAPTLYLYQRGIAKTSNTIVIGRSTFKPSLV